MRHVAIYAYNTGSKGARNLARALGSKIIKHVGSRFRARGKTVINWGASPFPGHAIGGSVINTPMTVANGRCKLRAFRLMKEAGVNIPDFTDSLQEAQGWLLAGDVCQRATTTGHEGIGLSVHPRGSNGLSRAPLYTKYIKKRLEFRVHVVGSATYVQRKLRKRGMDGDHQIRNTANGYVFSGLYDAPKDVIDQSTKAVRALGLDFGAVDVVWNDHYQKAYVLEVNTAPGIEGNTVVFYANALRRLLFNGQGR